MKHRPNRRHLDPKSVVVTLRRCTGLIPITTAAGQFLGFRDLALNNVETADLMSTFDAYRLKYVVARVTPQQDPGDSQYPGTSQIHCYLGCDVRTDLGTPQRVTQVSQLSSYRYQCLVAGRTFAYKFVPKPLLNVDNNGNSVAAAQVDGNPWIQLTTAGVTLPHHRLVIALMSSNSNNASTIDIVYEYVFEVRGFR